MKIDQIIKNSWFNVSPLPIHAYFIWLIEPYSIKHRVYPTLPAFKAAVVQFTLERLKCFPNAEANYDNAREIVNKLVKQGKIECLFVHHQKGITTARLIDLKPEMHKDHWAPQSPRNKARSKRLKNT